MVLRALIAFCLTLIPDSLALVEQSRVLPLDTKHAFVLSEVQSGLKIAARTRHFKYNPETATKIANAIMKWSAHFRIEPLLVLSVMTQESHFVPKLVSSAGAMGLMQVMPATVYGMCRTEKFPCPKGAQDFYDPEKNVEYGIRILDHMMECSENFLASLSAYNQGCAGARGDLQRGQNMWTFSTQIMTNYTAYSAHYYTIYPPKPLDFKPIRVEPPAPGVNPPAD